MLVGTGPTAAPPEGDRGICLSSFEEDRRFFFPFSSFFCLSFSRSLSLSSFFSLSLSRSFSRSFSLSSFFCLSLSRSFSRSFSFSSFFCLSLSFLASSWEQQFKRTMSGRYHSVYQPKQNFYFSPERSSIYGVIITSSHYWHHNIMM